MISFAQNGEDVVLWRLFRTLDRPGFFIDVGAGHPVTDSVTKWFSLNGWVGVNIEPVAHLQDQLVADRPMDVNLKVACGARAGTTSFVVAATTKWGHSSMDRAVAERLVADSADAETIEIEVVAASTLIERHAPATGVDLLKVDVEGVEDQVIAGAELARHRPRVLVIEAVAPGSLDPSHGSWEPMIFDSGYVCCLFDGLNRFYCLADDEIARRTLSYSASILDDYVTYREYVLRVALEKFASWLPTWSDTLSRLREPDPGQGGPW